MKLSGIADDTELKLAGTSGDMEQKRKNTVSLPSDLNNVTIQHTQAGDIADRNRRVENPRVQTGGLRPKDVAAAMKAAAVSGAGVNSNVWTSGAKADAMRAGSEDGASYGATRPDSFSDATQNKNDALITNNPGDVHLGGIVSPGSKIYGELPKEDSTFYINQKFEEVEPFPIMMPDGNLYNSRTSNLNKAEWQFWSDKVSAPDMGWAGYFKVAKPEGESVVQTAIRSAYNLIPEITLRAGQYTATAINTASYLYDWIAKDHDRALENYNYYQDMIEDTVRDYMDATKWYYSDASEAGANKYAIIVGQTLGSVGIASLGVRAAVAALAIGEGLSDAASVQQATRELGYSPLASLGVGALAGGVTGGLSFLPEYVFPNELDNLAKKTGKSLLNLAVRSPGAIAKTVAQNGWRRVILEAGTEVGQELFADYASTGFDSEKMEARWDEKTAIILASLVMGSAGLYHNISKAKKGEVELREFATKMNDMINAVEPELRRISSESGGLINDSNIDEILAHIKDPDFALQMTNIIRESIVGNFDKFSPEEKASLMEKIKSWDGEALLSGEFAKLEKRLDELLDGSGLTSDQKSRFRMYARGAAAWQLATLGIKPSEIELPAYITNVSGVEAKAKYFILDEVSNGLMTMDTINKMFDNLRAADSAYTVTMAVDEAINETLSSIDEQEAADFVRDYLTNARQEIIDTLTSVFSVDGFFDNDVGTIFVSTRHADIPFGEILSAPTNNEPIKGAQKTSADMARTFLDSGNVEAMDLSQSFGAVNAVHEFTHWLQFNTGLHGIDAYVKALSDVVDSIVPGLLQDIDKEKKTASARKKNTLDTSKAEAYAYAMGLAGANAAEVLGTEGKVADIMSFINMMLKASDASTKLSPRLQKVFDLFAETMKENKKLMNALLAEIPYEQLRGAIRDFVETGDPSNIGLDAIRALHVVLNSVVDGETSDLLGQVFANRAVAEDFMNATNTFYSNKAKAEREAERAVRDEVRKEADAIVGIATEEAPVINTVEDAVTEGIMDEIPEFNDAQESKTQETTSPDAKVKGKEEEPKVAADQDVKEWVESQATGPAAENRTGATKNIEEMAEQKLLEWRVHIPEIIRTELTSPVDDDLELVWSDSSDETPFKFSSAVRKDPKKRAQLHARLKQYYKTIVSEVNRRIESGEMSKGGEQFINKNGLFAVWNPNMLWSDDYVTHLANKIAGRLEGQVATEGEKQLYRAIREYETAIGYLYDGYVTDYLTFSSESNASGRTRSSTGSLIFMDDVSTISENTAERVYHAIDYLQELEAVLSTIPVSDDPKLLGFLYGLSEQNARRIAYKEVSEQYAHAIRKLSMSELGDTDYYKSRNIWLRDGLIKRVQNRIDWSRRKMISMLTDIEQLKAMPGSYLDELRSKAAVVDVNAIEDKIDQLTKMLEEAPQQAAELERIVESLENDYLSVLEKTEDPSKYDKKLERAAGRLYNAKQRLASVKSYGDIIPKQIQQLQNIMVGGGAKPRVKDLLKTFAHDNDDAMFAELDARNRELAAVTGDPYYYLSDKAYKVNVDKNGRPTDVIGATEASRRKRSLAIREELISLKKSYVDAKAEHKKALDAFNAQPTRENNGKLRKAAEAEKAARKEVIRAAQRHAELLEHVPVSSNGVYYPSIARFFSPKRLGGDFIRQNVQDEEGNELLLKTDESKWAQFINPARPERAVRQVHPITTPTPLEQIELESGFTFADAQKVVTDAGLTIPKLDLSVVTPEKIARYYDDGIATFSRVYARLLDQVVSWGGAESLDYATRMRVLVGIDMAKQTAREIVGEYQISKEIGFLMNPTRGVGITASAVEFDQSEKGAAVRAENAKQGYIAVANPYELRAGDQVAFAKGNKIVKAVVSYVLPVGENKAVFLRHLVDVSNIDVDNMTDKQMSALDKKMVEDIISASDLSKVAVMQKVAVKGDAERIGKMFDAYDKVFGAFERDNFTLEALETVPDDSLQGQIAADILENMQSVYDPYENFDEDDFGGNGMYAIMPDIVPSTPVIDPGKFVARGLFDANSNTTNPMTLSDEEFRELLGDPEEFEARLKAEAQLTQDQARSAVMDVALNAAKDYLRDMDKPSFTAAMNDTAYSGLPQTRGMTPRAQQEIVYNGLFETDTRKFLYWIGSATGLDRKLALNIGQGNAQKAYDFIGAASVAQQEKESWMQAMIENAVKDVFGGKRTAYDRWRIDIKNDKIEATVEGVKQKVSEAEVMSLYAMSKSPTMPGGKSQFERASAPFGGVEAAKALIKQLSPESKSFVDLVGSGTMNGISKHPEWVPAVDFIQYRGSGWASRKKNKVDFVSGYELVNSDSPLAALDYYDSLTKAIAKYAMDASGLRAQLESLQMIFEFDKHVDRSKFAPIVPGSADEQLFNEMSRRSKEMRDKLSEKIGARMANWFMKNIEYDLKNPAFLDEVAATPEAKWFGRFSRSSGASVLMLNIKQGLQNLGNYHRLFGLSGSNMFKYYVTDLVKAIAHTREAWALMKQNPELLRRLKQAGLSEHMMRVVDENADSIFTDIQAKFLEHGRNKASDITAFLGTVSNMATKWGLAPNVLGDALGLAWGNYAVYDHVRSQVDAANRAELMKRRDARDVDAIINEMTHREIGNYINSHVSSSNYMARSMFTKMMNKMGLGALVMFTNDQLQGFGSLAQAISVLQNSKDKIELERARKDIMGWAVSTVRYIAIKAGWYGALAAMAMGDDLSDEEMDYIWDSTISEAVMQMGGWHQLSNLGIAPVLRAIIDGDRLGPSIVSVSAAGRGISAARRGDWWDFASEAASMTFFPVANGLGRIVEAANYIMSSNEHEQQVGWKMLGGSSKGGAMESLGLSDKNKDKEVKPKKKLKKDGE